MRDNFYYLRYPNTDKADIVIGIFHTMPNVAAYSLNNMAQETAAALLTPLKPQTFLHRAEMLS